MKQSIGSTFVINFIVIFIVVMFAFLLGIMSYMKGFKVNSYIGNAIENNEGYNALATKEINRVLNGLGYKIDGTGASGCPVKKGARAINKGQNYRYCVYEYAKKNGYIKYGVITYISVDVPVVAQTISLPVYSETDRIYEFGSGT
ncbi:MAG: hypothetical protein PHN72_00410 [Bacilli bacterium]|nr:hypothetical protein [Bacilli bacterium]